MKFGLFYQLPCAPEQNEVTRYHETIEQIVYADELGFDTAWLAELHFNRPFSIMPAPLILAAVLAQRNISIPSAAGRSSDSRISMPSGSPSSSLTSETLSIRRVPTSSTRTS